MSDQQNIEPMASKRTSFFTNLGISTHIHGFKGPQELIDWVNKDNNATELFKWHDATRVTHDETTQAYNRLIEERIEQEAVLDRLKSELDGLKATAERDRIEHQGVIKHYQDQLRENTTASGATSTCYPPLSSNLPDPPLLTDGKDPNIDHWLSLMKDKLVVNHDHYPTDAIQIAYIKTRLSKDAAKRMGPYTRRGAIKPFKTADEMMDALFKIYGEATDEMDALFRVYRDPNRCIIASNAFRQLHQKNQDFEVFWARFLSLSAACDHDEATLVEELHKKVSPEIQEHLARGPEHPTELHELARTCRRIQARLHLVHKKKKSGLARILPARFLHRTQNHPATSTGPVATVVAENPTIEPHVPKPSHSTNQDPEKSSIQHHTVPKPSYSMYTYPEK